MKIENDTTDESKYKNKIIELFHEAFGEDDMQETISVMEVVLSRTDQSWEGLYSDIKVGIENGYSAEFQFKLMKKILINSIV